jgi:hypothetical protein
MQELENKISSNNIRIRYSRFGDSRIPKNTLVTERIGDFVYFGIARCNLKADVCIKVQGVAYAMENLKQSYALPDDKTKCYIKDTYGRCHVTFLPFMLEHFYSLDHR